MSWWRHVVAMELRKLLAYRTDFWVTFLGQTLIQLVVASALWKSVYESQGLKEMQGFTLEMMQLYYLIIPIGTRILTGENIGFLSREIYEGTFTRYLLYPLSVFQYKTLTYLSYSLFYGLQLLLLYLLFRTFMGSSPITFSELGFLFLGFLMFLLAAFTYAMMAMMVELLALWADNIWSLMVMLRFFSAFLGGGFIPLSFFPDWSQRLLAWTPFPYLISLPARTTMGLTTFEEIISGTVLNIAWALFFIILVQLLWKRGEKQYTGVGI